MISFTLLFLFATIFASSGSAQTMDHRAMLQGCHVDITNCDFASPTKLRDDRIAEITQDRNLRECLTGSALCDQGPLTPSQSPSLLIPRIAPIGLFP
jgi:hypothetical protein